MSDSAPSLRDTIASAMEAQTDAPEPVEAAPEAAPAPVDAPVVEAAPEASPSRARDESGRFTKTEKPAAAPEGVEKAAKGEAAAAGKGKADGTATPPVPSAEPAKPAVRAPQSWSPAARDAFAKAPPEVQREVERREREITRTLSETADARKTAQAVHQTLAPFEGLARSQGMDAMSYAGSVLQTAAQLFQGPPQARVAILANLIQQAGLTDEASLTAIGNALQNPQAVPQQQRPMVDPRLEVRRILDEERAEEARQANRRAVDEFLENPPEFFHDVKDDLPEIIRLDRARGGNLTLAQAYERACKYNPQVQEVLASRKATDAARAAAPTVQRSRAAAVSIKPSAVAATPRGSTGTPSLRETIEAAVAGQRT